MGLIEDILKHVSGKADFSLDIEGKPAAEIKVDGKKVTIEVRNPSVALEFAGKRLFQGKGIGESKTLGRLKKAGFTIKAKYGMLEIDI